MPSHQSQRKLLKSGHTEFPLCFLLLATAQARFLELRGTPAVEPGKKQQSLLHQKARDPGFFRNFGVRAGTPAEDLGAFGDGGSKYDSTMVRENLRGGDGMSFEFPFVDNLQPVAPMDRVHDGHGAYGMDPAYVSEYQNPDSFPTVAGPGCLCTYPKAPDKKIQCDCGKSSVHDHYTWLKDAPVVGTNKYKLTPADITYRAGDYWQPQHRGGIVAPADKLPPESYPNQAPPDRIWPLPASADFDRIGIKYARYVDQLNARAEECDTVSERCTVSCRPGDAVTMEMGNALIDAKVIQSFVGNVIQVEFTPNAASSAATSTTTCPVEAACTAFRFCKSAWGNCVAMKDIESHTWAGSLVWKHECPSGSQVCRSINQMVMATLLRKDGKACKAGPGQLQQQQRQPSFQPIMQQSGPGPAPAPVPAPMPALR